MNKHIQFILGSIVFCACVVLVLLATEVHATSVVEFRQEIVIPTDDTIYEPTIEIDLPNTTGVYICDVFRYDGCLAKIGQNKSWESFITSLGVPSPTVTKITFVDTNLLVFYTY